MRPNWVEISRSALLHNLAAVRSCIGANVQVCAVVKANAYGHGAALCAQIFQSGGVNWFAVTSCEEGVSLRQSGIRGRILVLGGFDKTEAELLVQHHLTPAVWDEEQVGTFAAAAAACGGGRPAVHVKLDTGMARLGADAQHQTELFRSLQRHNVPAEALFTHFSSADDRQATATEEQLARFRVMERRWHEMANGSAPRLRHLSNSAAVLRLRPADESFVRVGLALYGYSSSAVEEQESGTPAIDLRPALTWKTRIISLREVPAGTPIGYSGAYVTRRATRVATVALGYADGYMRRLYRPEAAANVVVRGVLASVIGNISMDLTTIDVTDVAGVQVGDEVVIIGAQDRASTGGSAVPVSVTAQELSEVAGTIVYEILTSVSMRVPRIIIV